MGAIGRAGTVTIASSGTVSNAIDLGEGVLVGIQMPAAFTGIALTFQASDSLAGTYNAVTSISAAYSVTVAAAKYVSISPNDLAGVRFIKVVSGSAEGADRDIILMVRNLR